MTTRQGTRFRDSGTTQGSLSDTEDMDDDDDDDDVSDDDNDNPTMLNIQRNNRRPLQVIESDDEISNTSTEVYEMNSADNSTLVWGENNSWDSNSATPEYASSNDDGIIETDNSTDSGSLILMDDHIGQNNEVDGIPEGSESDITYDPTDGEDADSLHSHIEAEVEEVAHELATNEDNNSDTASNMSEDYEVETDPVEGPAPEVPTCNTESAQSEPGTNTASIAQPSTSSSASGMDKDDEGQTCPICFDAWSNMGEHRIVSLRCGHLFGRKCIERWLKGPGGGKCPQCNAKATKRDIRVIYARALKAEDTSEKERLMHEIARLRREREEAERQKAHQALKMSQDSQLIRQLQEELRVMKESVAMNAQATPALNKAQPPRLALFKSFDLIKTGSCRVMAYNEWMSMLVVSASSQMEVFPGFVIKKLNTFDFKIAGELHLHSKQIRDLAFSPSRRDLILSVGIDRLAKVTNVASNSLVVAYTVQHHLWSCCWRDGSSTEFFAGSAAGDVYHFDTVESSTEAVRSLRPPGFGPVLSIACVAGGRGDAPYGLLITRLSAVSFVAMSDFKAHLLPIDGPFSHTAFDSASAHFLVTRRPTGANPHAQHAVYRFRLQPELSVEQIHFFQGSTTMTVLTRSCLASGCGGQARGPIAIFAEESTSVVRVCDLSTFTQLQMIKCPSRVIDVLSFGSAPDHSAYVALLSERTLKIFKWMNV